MPSSTAGTVKPGDFHQAAWDADLARRVDECIPAWLAEDLGAECDWTSVALLPPAQVGRAVVVPRSAGVIAGLEAAGLVARAVDEGLTWEPHMTDGARVEAGTAVAVFSGPVRSMLVAERTILNLLGRMSGVATATRRLVDAVAGTRCHVYDTRKTVPGWRLLDKFATRAGGGWNHRTGLFDAILIKDNHLSALAERGSGPAEAVRIARGFVRRSFPGDRAATTTVEIEVDSIAQLRDVLPERPDVVLLDNMPLEDLRAAVAIRDDQAPDTLLEASGGVGPDTIAAIAKTGVDRVSTGWPCHHAPWLDLGLDWD